MEEVLSKDKDVRFYTAYTGAGAPRFYLSLIPSCRTRATPSSS